MSYRYEIDNENAIRIWDDANPNELGAPFFFQPDWPDATPWASKDEAKEWAELFIESISNPDSEFIPGNCPSEPRVLRPVAEAEIVEEENA